MMLYPEIWKTLPIYKVKHEKIKELLGIRKENSIFSFNDIYAKYDQYKLENDT